MDLNWPMNSAEVEDIYSDLWNRVERQVEVLNRLTTNFEMLHEASMGHSLDPAENLQIAADEIESFLNDEFSPGPRLPDAALMALPQATLVKEMLNGADHADCSICIDHICIGEEVIQLTSCKHLFHRKCILDWSQYQKNCPLCRGKLTAEKESEKK